MKRILLLLVMAAIAVVDISAQHEVRITTKDGTTEIPLDEISRISVSNNPWSSWAPIKGHETGTYYMSLYYKTLEFHDTVFYREHKHDETKAQFMFRFTLIGAKEALLHRLISAKEDLIVDYNKETHQCQVGIHHFTDNSTYGPVFVSDMPHYPLQPGIPYDKYPCSFDPETGTFTLNLVYFVHTGLGSFTDGYFGYGEETMQLDGFKQYDYSFSMVFDGKHTEQGENKEYAMFNIVKGADISKYLFHVVEEGNDLDATIAGMADGTIGCMELTESTVLHNPIGKSGKYVALAITYDAKGNVHSEYSTNFEFYLTDENPWVSLGMATYTEDCLTTFFDVPNEVYQVEVRQNKDNPGLYRIIHPYAAYGAATDKEYYIEIDATDPEGVYIPGVHGTGFNAGYGEVSITSMVYYYMANQGYLLEELKDAGYCGVFADNVITFPAEALLISMSAYQNGAWYKSNKNGAFKLDMSNMQPAETAVAKAPAMRFEGGRKLSICNKAKRVLRTVEVKKSKSIPAGIKSTEGFDPTIIEE